MIIDIFRAILYLPLLNLLNFFNWALPGHFAAISILLVTLVVRFALLVPSRKAAETQRKINQLQPVLAELKKEYGDDRQGLAAAQMELYKKNQINPLGSSCLPSIIQLVVLLVFYQVIRQGLTTDATGIYAWMPHAASVNTNAFGIDLLQGDKYYIFPIIAAVLQYFLMRMINPPVKPNSDGDVDPMMAAQRNMTFLLPAMTLFAASRFAAGISFYWVITTAFSIAQQAQVNKKKFEIAGVDTALIEADHKHPEHPKRTATVEKQIAEETSNKKGVQVTVRKKK